MKIFFSDYEIGEHIDGEEAIIVSHEDILSKFDEISDLEENFFGIIDNSNITIQFYWEEDGSISIDIPIPQKKGSLTKKSNHEECRKIIENIDRKIDISAINGLHFQKWQLK